MLQLQKKQSLKGLLIEILFLYFSVENTEIGIDAPENTENNKAHRNSNRFDKDIKTIISHGKQAIAFIKAYLKKGDVVLLEFDIVKHDKYGRTLAYIYLSDRRSLNNLMISSCYASPLIIAPNVKYKNLF